MAEATETGRTCQECGHRLGGDLAEIQNWTVCGGGAHCTCKEMAERTTTETHD